VLKSRACSFLSFATPLAVLFHLFDGVGPGVLGTLFLLLNIVVSSIIHVRMLSHAGIGLDTDIDLVWSQLAIWILPRNPLIYNVILSISSRKAGAIEAVLELI
jgi:hypothetical protein